MCISFECLFSGVTCGLYVHVGKGTCAPEEFQCPSFNGTASRCISNSWKCDGEKDCAGGEDEIGCGKLECPTGTFNCTGENVCLTTAWQCDGDVDCSSGDDEANCDDLPPATKNLCTDIEFHVSLCSDLPSPCWCWKISKFLKFDVICYL